MRHTPVIMQLSFKLNLYKACVLSVVSTALPLPLLKLGAELQKTLRKCEFGPSSMRETNKTLS
jgi:hypothetical protein